MCLILFAKNEHPNNKIVLAANRDEFYDRPTSPADYWDDNNKILGGRDILSGGTWLGINKNGRFIAITNYRDPQRSDPSALSRGEISRIFLNEKSEVPNFLEELSKSKLNYNGFNLVLSDDGFKTLYHYSNINDQITKIESGIHGLGNHLLDTPWPKIEKGKKELARLIKKDNLKSSDLIKILKDNTEARDDLLPKTGISFDLEKKLSPVFISMNGYGTRCSTAILIDKNNYLSFLEVTYDENRVLTHKKSYKFKLDV